MCCLFFNDPATPEIYPYWHSLSLHDVIPLYAVHFIAPERRGDLLIFNAAVNRAWRTSMEIGVKVDARSYDGATRRHILSAYMTFVAVDANGNPCPVPPLLPETEIDRFRYEEAQLRRELRLSHANRKSTRLNSSH